MRVRVTKRADAHNDQPATRREQNRPTAHGAVDDELAEALSMLSTQPDIGVPALNVRTKDVRRILLLRIHYHLYYRSVPTKCKFSHSGTQAVAQVQGFK